MSKLYSELYDSDEKLPIYNPSTGAYLSLYSILENLKYKRRKNPGVERFDICPEWLDKENGYRNFFDWASAQGYGDGMFIIRHDMYKPYTPENAYVSEKKQNNRHVSILVFTIIDGITAKQYAAEHGISECMMRRYIDMGLSSGKQIDAYRNNSVKYRNCVSPIVRPRSEDTYLEFRGRKT